MTRESQDRRKFMTHLTHNKIFMGLIALVMFVGLGMTTGCRKKSSRRSSEIGRAHV